MRRVDFRMTYSPFVSPAVRGIPALSGFIDEASGRCRRSDPSTFWSMQSSFDALLQPQVWQAFYLAVVESVLARPAFDGGREWHSSGLAVYDGQECSLSLRIRNDNDADLPEPAESERALVSTRPAPAMLASLSEQPLPLRFHPLPVDTDLDVYDPACRLAPHRDVVAQAWSRVDVHAPLEIVEVRALTHQPWCLLEFSLKPLVMQRWEFDASTGAPVGAALATTHSACLLAMLDEITRYRFADAWPEVSSLTDHADFNVRWAALRCLGKIHPPAAIEALGRLKSDRHPMVAAMAASLWARMNPNCADTTGKAD